MEEFPDNLSRGIFENLSTRILMSAELPANDLWGFLLFSFSFKNKDFIYLQSLGHI
jgi:hypothetical protein